MGFNVDHVLSLDGYETLRRGGAEVSYYRRMGPGTLDVSPTERIERLRSRHPSTRHALALCYRPRDGEEGWTGQVRARLFARTPHRFQQDQCVFAAPLLVLARLIDLLHQR